jgi:hypothetical protein
MMHYMIKFFILFQFFLNEGQKSKEPYTDICVITKMPGAAGFMFAEL